MPALHPRGSLSPRKRHDPHQRSPETLFPGSTVTVEDPENNTARVEVDPVTGEVTLTFEE